MDCSCLTLLKNGSTQLCATRSQPPRKWVIRQRIKFLGYNSEKTDTVYPTGTMTLPSTKPALLSLQFFSYPDAIGGAWKYTHEVNRRLAGRGWPVHLITCKPQDTRLPDEEIVDGVVFHRLSTADSKNFFRLGRKLNRLIKQITETQNIRLVHVHNPLIGYLATKNAVLREAAWVVHVHSLWQDEERINRLGPEMSPTLLSPVWWRLLAIRYIEWSLFRRTDSCLFLSRYMQKSFLGNFPFRKPRLRIIPGGVDTDHFRPAANDAARLEMRTRLGLPEGTTVLLTVRRLEARMGIDRLLDALRHIEGRGSDKNYLLAIVGKGSLEDELRHRAEVCGLSDKVRFVGEVSPQELVAYYQSADVFILPTVELEGFGLATVEAMACGLPVLGTPVGGTVEILKSLDPRCLFSNATAEAMARRIEMFLNDTESFRQLGPKCRELAEAQYDWRRVVDRIEEELSLLLNR